MSTAPIFIVSGGMGVSGGQLVRTALAQFQDIEVPVIVVPHVRQEEELEPVVEQVAASGGILVHTLVDESLRHALIDLAQTRGVTAIDLIGPLLLQVTGIVGREPLGRPGLYRLLHEDYFNRIEAIEFTVEHDDGRKPYALHQAEIVLAGVSRVGKTPISMYLAVQGWKAANVPLIPGVTPPKELFEIDHRRVVGLTVEPGQLVHYRRRRQRGLGLSGQTAYADPEGLYEEVEYARRIFQQGRFAVVDITDRPIEECANEIVAQVNRRLSVDVG